MDIGFPRSRELNLLPLILKVFGGEGLKLMESAPQKVQREKVHHRDFLVKGP